jgi:hypothetical protein
VNGLRDRAAGAGGQHAPAALDWRFWAAPQLHRSAPNARSLLSWSSESGTPAGCFGVNRAHRGFYASTPGPRAPPPDAPADYDRLKNLYEPVARITGAMFVLGVIWAGKRNVVLCDRSSISN